MAYRVEVDRNVCISSGRCMGDAPGLLRFDEDEIAEFMPGGEQVPDKTMVDLACACPSGALRVFDGDQPVMVI